MILQLPNQLNETQICHAEFRYYFANCSTWYRILDTEVSHETKNVAYTRVRFSRMPGFFHSNSQCLYFDHVIACSCTQFSVRYLMHSKSSSIG